MRPQSVVLFERLYLVALALRAAVVGLTFALFAARPLARGIGIAAGLAILAVLLALALLVSRRRNRVAMWVLVVVTIGGLLLSLPNLPAVLRGGAIGWLSFAQALLSAAAVALLFTAPARAWLKGARDAD